MEQRDKSEKVEAVAEWTLRIIDAHGLDGVSIARVARAASVSRPWMYKYVGRGKEELIEVAVRRFGMLISGLDRRPRLDSRENWVHDTMANTQRLFLNSRERPWMLRLYYRFKGTHTVLGEVIADLESRYLGAHTREIAEVWGMPEEESRILAESLMAARLGMAHRYQYREEVEEDDRGRFFALLRRWLSGISPVLRNEAASARPRARSRRMLSSLIVAFDEPDGTISSQGQTHTVGRGSIPTTQARRASRRTSFLIAGGAVILLGTIVFLSQQRSAQPIDSTEPSPVLDPARARAENTARPARPTASPGPSLEALSAVKTLLSAQQFLLATPARYEPFGEDLTFDRGYILVFETDPKISLASIEKRPVLYIGAVPAEVFDVSPSSGRVIAFAPGDIDLAETPIFFGSTLPAEKVDATRGRAERDAAIALGVSPPPAHELAGAVAAGGALLQARDIGELTRHLGDIRAAWSKVDAGSVRIGSRSQ